MHVPIDTLQMFAQMNNMHPRFVDWLREERTNVRKVLDNAEKNVQIFRSQGDLQRLDMMLKLLETSGEALKKGGR